VLVPIRYDACTYSVKVRPGIVSLSSAAGRLTVPVASDPHAQGILDHAVGFASADLIYCLGRFWLHVVLTLPNVEFQPAGSVVGVDVGLARPAVCSNNRFFGERRWKDIERRYFRLRRSLQRKGTRGARSLASIHAIRRRCARVAVMSIAPIAGPNVSSGAGYADSIFTPTSTPPATSPGSTWPAVACLPLAGRRQPASRASPRKRARCKPTALAVG